MYDAIAVPVPKKKIKSALNWIDPMRLNETGGPQLRRGF